MSKFFFVVYHIIVLLALSSPKLSYSEPIPIRNHSPMFFGILFPTFDSPRTLLEEDTKVDFTMNYSGIFNFRYKDDWIAEFDMDLTEIAVEMRKGYSNGLELGINIPVLYLGAGFLDQVILDFHKTIGVDDSPGPEDEPRNRYRYRLAYKGKEWNSPTPNKFLLGDIALWAKKELLSAEKSIISIKMILEAPTASTTSGLGNGSPEFAVLLLAERRFEKLTFDLNFGAVAPGYIDRGEKYALNNYYFIRGSFSYPIFRRFSITIQGTSSEVPIIEKKWNEITVGGRYKMASGRIITVGFLEDVDTAAPDFTFYLSTTL